MAKITGINKLFWHKEGNTLTKNLRFVKPSEGSEEEPFMFILSKDNDIVGFWPGKFPVWFDARFEEKWGKEIRGQYKIGNYLKICENHEEWLLKLTQSIFNLSQTEVDESRRGVTACLHVRTVFHTFDNARCPDCRQEVSPNLVMGYLLTAASELNEMMWEQKGARTSAREKAAIKNVDDEEDGEAEPDEN